MTRPIDRALVLTVVVAIALPVAAAWASGTKSRACTVLKRAEIRRVVRDSVKLSAREQRTPKSASICNWEVGPSDRGTLVSVWVQRGKQAREGYDVSERVFGLGSEPLPELGRLAFYSAEAGAAYVFDGSTLLYVQRLDETGAIDPTALRDQAVEMAGLAHERLRTREAGMRPLASNA